MNFSISLPKVLRKTIGLNAFGELYDILLGFNIIIVVEILKWEDQKPRLKHEFTILIKLYKHILFLRICLRWLQESLSGLGVEELLHLVIAIMNSSSENPFHWDTGKGNISSSILSLTIRCWAVLNELCNTCHRLWILRYGWLLYLMVSIAGSFHLLTWFISSHKPCFLFTISCILRSKNILFVDLTILLKAFQSLRLLVIL